MSDYTENKTPNLIINTLEDPSKLSEITVGENEIVLVPDETEEELAKKVDKVSTASQIYGTDANGDQTTYNKSDFQDKLTAGTNITIDANNVISSTAQESFFRGKWNTWSNVPTDTDLYPSDYKGSHIPTESDYMVVEDASGFVPGLDIELFIPQTGTRKFTLGGEEKLVPDYPNEVSWVLPDITITASFHNGIRSWFTANKTVKCDNVIYAAGDTFAKVQYYSDPGPTIYYSNSDSLSGAWRFSYRGTWATDNVSGWKPEYQVEDVLPIASSTVQGIAKLYNTTGQNTDGSITQKLFTDTTDNKLDKVTTASKLYGTTDQGVQTTYDVDYFQKKLVAGNNITIDANSKIDAADKTLVSFVIWEDDTPTPGE